MVNPSSLYADETQYWVWSRDLDWGYFSKPPLIARIIAATTAVFGDSDWAVRLAAPLLHTATALLLALSADRLFGRTAAARTFIVWLTLPSVWLSAAVISTDAVLLTCWALALYGFVRLREGAGWSAVIMLGAGMGLGMLAKYAMSYFAAGLILAALLDPVSRRALLQTRLLAAAALAGLIVLPNLIWNWRNDFATVSHTAANANWGGDMFNPGEAASFVIDQLGVFGPAFFVTLVAGVVALARRWRSGQADMRLVVLACFCVPALLVVTGQAFLSRAHANWAASAYAAACVLVVFVLLRGPRWRRWVLAGSVALHACGHRLCHLCHESRPCRTGRACQCLQAGARLAGNGHGPCRRGGAGRRQRAGVRQPERLPPDAALWRRGASRPLHVDALWRRHQSRRAGLGTAGGL